MATTPSPLPNTMGSVLHDGGCTFRVWGPFASSVSVRLFGAGPAQVIPLGQDSAAGFGNEVWSVFVPGVTESSQYRYVVDFPGGTRERIDPYGRSIIYPNFTPANPDTSDPRSIVTDRTFDFGAPFQAPGWRELVIYQLHVGTFFDQSAPGANPIDALISRVPYLQDLGVNAVQLLPFAEFSSSLSLGYDTVLPFAIERDYGRPQDMKRLVKALHAAGIAVLVDVVFNHLDVSSGGGPPFDYSLFQYDGFSGTPCGIFFYGGDEMNTPFGGPRPDFGRQAVRQFLGDNVMMWLDEYQMDGVRMDSTKCIRRRQGPCGDQCCGADLGVDRNFGWELMQGINDRIGASQPWKLSIAEDLDGNGAITNPTDRGGAGFDAQWDTDLQGALIGGLTQVADSAVDVGSIADRIANSFEEDAFERIIYLESHDQAKQKRVPDLISPGSAESWYARKKSLLGFAVVMTSPGIPMLFQGAELLDFRRWSPDNPPTVMDFARRNRLSRLFQCYRDLITLRKSSPGLAGSGVHVSVANPATKIISYHRWNRGSGSDDLVVVANFSTTTFAGYTIGFPFAGTWRLRLNTDANVYSDANDFGAVQSFDVEAGPGGYDGMPFSGSVSIGPYTVLVFSRA